VIRRWLVLSLVIAGIGACTRVVVLTTATDANPFVKGSDDVDAAVRFDAVPDAFVIGDASVVDAPHD
jgi:hypothetical protein